MRRTRFESIGRYTPETVVSTKELISRLRIRGFPPLERLSGVRNRRVYDSRPDHYESSFVLARRAMEDCLRHSDYAADELDIIISASITRTTGPGIHSAAPAFALMLGNAIGANKARHFDVCNASAGMMTGVLVLDRMIKAGIVRNGMVVSGEQLTIITETAVREIKSRHDSQLAALTVGDAGMAVIIDDRGDDDDEIHYIELMTMAAGADICIGMPSDRTNGIALYTDTRAMQNDAVYQQVIDRLVAFAQTSGRTARGEGFDFCIYHQFSAPAIAYIHRLARKAFGTRPKVLNILHEYGNTASTSHFLVLHEHLRQQRIPKGSKILMLPQASGVVGGFCAATISRLEV
ncbi:3-oxoacyl-ACP synthase [Nocardia sp. CDC159]|uniref:3-oxoacyl-ACP synthase n=1 Tax=Nocardia pulmonis TaxID=2951408 RepID=A0A9X2IYJ6_9NOCA|nr:MULTISPECIES: 3-oxoacyl-[acyl-carrier-protein] synthase III C-terminal domain-containing protein [Nocardia]MCM6777112.1 3-oxoacyl-ACP synthase [Nocardia pulmonis]MCM6789997.1 3-oxoacyl-ACP synthase [Nocardia sp. CDC159]